MKKRETHQPEQQDYTDLTVPAFGYELLRETLLPELLGKETPSILYWCGRNLARKYPLETFEDITVFFHHAGWGSLTVNEEGKNSLSCELSSELISKRTNHIKKPSFALESGFLAQQIQTIKKRTSESHDLIKKGGIIKFVIEWDQKDKIESDTEQY